MATQLPPGFVLDGAGGQSSGTRADPVIAPPDPFKQSNERRANRSAEIDEIDLEIKRRGERRQVDNDIFDQSAKLRNEFASSPQFKEYQTVIRQYASALRTDATPTGDQALITAYAKMLDPTSVVREAEFNVTANADSAIGKLYTKLAKELGIDGGGMLRPEVRARVRAEMRNLTDEYGRSYDQIRSQYEGLANSYGFDPSSIVGPHLRQPYEKDINDFWSRQDGETEIQPVGGQAGANPWPGVVGEDGKPLPPEGGYGRDPVTGEWSFYSTTTDDSPAGSNLGPDGKPRVSGNDPGYMQIAAGVGDIVEGGLNNTIGLIANPVNTNLFRGLGYDGFTSNIGAAAREGLGLPYGNETIGTVNQAASGGFSAAGGANRLASLANPGLMRNALAEYGSRPMLDMATGGSAAASGEFARQAGAGPVGQAAAIVAGGAAPSALMGSRNALLGVGRSNPPTDFDPALVLAGERQGVPIRQPDAIPTRRNETAAIETTSRGGPIIQQARANDNTRIEQRVDEIGGDGSPQGPYALGRQVQGAGTRYIDRTRGEKNERYLRAERIANGQRVSPQKAIAAVDQNIAELEAAGTNTNSATIAYLRGLREDLSKADGFSITEFQALRSAAGKKIKGDNALTSSDADRRLANVVQSFSADASEQLPEAAAAALDEADSFYAQRQDFISNVLRNVMGSRGNPLPAESAAERLIGMTRGKGDYDRFARMWGELSASEKADVSATVAASLGRKANGEFSPAALVRSIDPRNGISPQTARLIFGAEGARALADLRAISQAKTATATALNNSRSGTVFQKVKNGLRTLLVTSLGFQAGGVGGAVAAPVAQGVVSRWGEERAARALMNPDFTKWLREAPEATDPKAINAYFKRLEVQAAKSPVLAADVRALQEALGETFGRSPDKLAAQEQEND